MNISNTGASPAWPVSKVAGTRTATAAKETGSASADQVKDDFLKLAKMSPMERMRANILKSMDLTEERLGALSLQERQKIEDQIRDQIKTAMARNGGRDRLVDILA